MDFSQQQKKKERWLFNRYKIPSTGNPDVKAARDKARKFKGDLAMAEKDYKTVKRLVEDKESALKNLLDTFTKESGPFQRKLQQVCNSASINI